MNPKLQRPKSLMKRMSFSRCVLATLFFGISFFQGCKTPEPRDPRQSIPKDKEYYNEALGFSLHYPNLLNLRVEEKEGADISGIILKLQYPGNDFTVFELITRPVGWREGLRKHVVEGSEDRKEIDGLEAEGFDIRLPVDGEVKRKRVILEHMSMLYVFTGRGKTFDEILQSFAFIDNEKEKQAGQHPGDASR